MKIQIACPVIYVDMKIESQIIDDVKPFTAFVLKALSDGYTAKQISDVVGLGDAIIDEEISYLRGIGFLSKEEFGKLSVRGQEFCHLVTAIETIEKLGTKACVELHTGKVISPIFAAQPFPENVPRIPKRVHVNSLYARNYGDALDYAKETHEEALACLTEMQRESLYVQLSFDREEICYSPLQWEYLPPYKVVTTAQGDRVLRFRRSVICIDYTLRDTSLDKYRKILDSLSAVNAVHHELLSEQGQHLSARYEQESRRTKSKYYDNLAGVFIEDGLVRAEPSEDCIDLPMRFNTKSRGWEKSCVEYFQYNIDREANIGEDEGRFQSQITLSSDYHLLEVPFDLFLEYTQKRILLERLVIVLKKCSGGDCNSHRKSL